MAFSTHNKFPTMLYAECFLLARYGYLQYFIRESDFAYPSRFFGWVIKLALECWETLLRIWGLRLEMVLNYLCVNQKNDFFADIRR